MYLAITMIMGRRNEALGKIGKSRYLNSEIFMLAQIVLLNTALGGGYL